MVTRLAGRCSAPAGMGKTLRIRPVAAQSPPSFPASAYAGVKSKEWGARQTPPGSEQRSWMRTQKGYRVVVRKGLREAHRGVRVTTTPLGSVRYEISQNQAIEDLDCRACSAWHTPFASHTAMALSCSRSFLEGRRPRRPVPRRLADGPRSAPPRPLTPAGTSPRSPAAGPSTSRTSRRWKTL